MEVGEGAQVQERLSVDEFEEVQPARGPWARWCSTASAATVIGTTVCLVGIAVTWVAMAQILHAIQGSDASGNTGYDKVQSAKCLVSDTGERAIMAHRRACACAWAWACA